MYSPGYLSLICHAYYMKVFGISLCVVARLYLPFGGRGCKVVVQYPTLECELEMVS